MTLSNILVVIVLAILFALFAMIPLARIWYPASCAYNWIFERRMYKEFQRALQQIKEGTKIPIYSLAYFCYKELYNQYTNEWKDKFNLIVHSDGPSLYLGDKLIITQFDKPLLDKLVKTLDYPSKIINLLQYIEMDCETVGFQNFLNKYIDSGEGTDDFQHDKNGLLDQSDFCRRYLRAKRVELKIFDELPKDEKDKGSDANQTPIDTIHTEDEQVVAVAEVKVEEDTKVEMPVEAKKNPEEKPKKKITHKKADADKPAKKATKKTAKKTTKKTTKKEEQA